MPRWTATFGVDRRVIDPVPRTLPSGMWIVGRAAVPLPQNAVRLRIAAESVPSSR
jgi:hypothetical protein